MLTGAISLTACRNLLAKMEAGCVEGGNGGDGGVTLNFRVIVAGYSGGTCIFFLTYAAEQK